MPRQRHFKKDLSKCTFGKLNLILLKKVLQSGNKFPLKAKCCFYLIKGQLKMTSHKFESAREQSRRT